MMVETMQIHGGGGHSMIRTERRDRPFLGFIELDTAS
jgi:hypothetical protein